MNLSRCTPDLLRLFCIGFAVLSVSAAAFPYFLLSPQATVVIGSLLMVGLLLGIMFSPSLAPRRGLAAVDSLDQANDPELAVEDRSRRIVWKSGAIRSRRVCLLTVSSLCVGGGTLILLRARRSSSTRPHPDNFSRTQLNSPTPILRHSPAKGVPLIIDTDMSFDVDDVGAVCEYAARAAHLIRSATPLL